MLHMMVGKLFKGHYSNPIAYETIVKKIDEEAFEGKSPRQFISHRKDIGFALVFRKKGLFSDNVNYKIIEKADLRGNLASTIDHSDYYNIKTLDNKIVSVSMRDDLVYLDHGVEFKRLKGIVQDLIPKPAYAIR